jgi:hypothetical protein
MKSMSAGMTEAERKQFAADCMSVVFQDALKSAVARLGDPAKSKAEPDKAMMFKPLNGLTATEIHAKAEEVRARMSGPRTQP